MFKISAVCVILLLSVNIQDIHCLSEEIEELILMLHNTCKETTGVSEDTIQGAKKGIFPEDPKLKCYMKCLMEQMATIDDDGIIDSEAIIAVLPEEVKPHIEGVITKCGTQKGVDACDNAFKTNKCYYENAPAHYFLP